MPHLGVDPVVAGAAFVQAAQTLVSRTLDPIDAGVVSVTQFHAGEAYNVIPDRAELCGTVRTFSAEVRDRLERGLRQVAEGIAQSHGVEVDFQFRRGYPPTVNTAAEAALCAEAARTVVGADHVFTVRRASMGAEDFAYFLQEKPGAYIWIGNGPGEGGCMLHNPRYDFNDEVMPAGVAYWCALVQRLLGGEK
jgi:hippurate hydrolase